MTEKKGDHRFPIAAFGRNQTRDSKPESRSKSQCPNPDCQTTSRKEQPEFFEKNKNSGMCNTDSTDKEKKGLG